MPSGVQVWNENAVLIFDTSTQTVKFFGYLTIAASSQSGSITDSRFSSYSGHRAFACRTDGRLPNVLDAQITISGNTLSWSRQTYSDGESPQENVFVYGVSAM